MKILIATKNQAKIEGAKKALSRYYSNIEISGIPVPSEVSEQPVNQDIYKGAKNRIKNLKLFAKQNNIHADFYLSIESGINNFFEEWVITNVAIISDNNNHESLATSASFPVPKKYVNEIINSDLSQVMNKIFTKDNDRHTKGGGIQLLTHNTVTRIDLTEQAFIMALTKFINEDKWN